MKRSLSEHAARFDEKAPEYDAMTDAGFVVTAVERVHEQVGVIACERGEMG
jgi:hypothetical protein